MTPRYLIELTEAQLKALKWAAAHSQSMYEASIPETERSIAFFAERREEDHAKLARQNLDNARRHLADIQAASPVLYEAILFPSPALPSHGAAHEAVPVASRSSGDEDGTSPPAPDLAGGTLECNHALLAHAWESY